MPLKDLLKKRDRHKSHDEHDPPPPPPAAPGITILRSDTHTQEILQPPSFADDSSTNSNTDPTSTPGHERAVPPKRPGSRFRSVSSISLTSTSTSSQSDGRRLSQRLHLRSHSYASSRSSVNVPSDLPSISDGVGEGEDGEEKEAAWEERATRLARGNPLGLGREGGGGGRGPDGEGEGGGGRGGDVGFPGRSGLVAGWLADGWVCRRISRRRLGCMRLVVSVWYQA